MSLVENVSRAFAISNKQAETIDRLRGQLQNCVNHLERAKRRQNRRDYDEAIESANKALYETLDY